ncbi:hypothetical protein RRSWK_00084 [Rhodopirellula sp. SWK7]|nr:hypothetical protein RRSWK_00084 [Rhodopirellula sp. SWK7]
MKCSNRFLREFAIKSSERQAAIDASSRRHSAECHGNECVEDFMKT